MTRLPALTGQGWLVDTFVPGRPAPQGSKRHVGRGIMIESSKAVAPWRTTVAWHVSQKFTGPVALGGIYISLDFRMPRPVSTPKSKSPMAIKRPDVDKLIRAILDALSGVVYKDDSQIVLLSARKVLTAPDEQPGVQINIKEYT